MDISLLPLYERPQEAKLVLTWALELWGERYPSYSKESWATFYADAAKPALQKWIGNGQELVYLAKRNGETLGTIALVDFDDLTEFRHLSPWIAAFIVRPDLRGTGIGSQILSLFEDQARALGVTTLHLWTEDQAAFYLKRGYGILASSTMDSHEIQVLSKELRDYS